MIALPTLPSCLACTIVSPCLSGRGATKASGLCTNGAWTSGTGEDRKSTCAGEQSGYVYIDDVSIVNQRMHTRT